MGANNTAKKHPGGRPTVMTEAVIGKLEQAFAYDSTIKEACFYAGINPDTYFAYAKEHPEFSERVEALRQRPILAAREEVVKAIKTDPRNAQWYLERKRKDEFSIKQEVKADNLNINENLNLNTDLPETEAKSLVDGYIEHLKRNTTQD